MERWSWERQGRMSVEEVNVQEICWLSISVRHVGLNWAIRPLFLLSARRCQVCSLISFSLCFCWHLFLSSRLTYSVYPHPSIPNSMEHSLISAFTDLSSFESRLFTLKPEISAYLTAYPYQQSIFLKTYLPIYVFTDSLKFIHKLL